MKTETEICAHRVSFDYFTRSKNAVPSDSEIEHVQALINEGYTSGELCMSSPRGHEFRGWWQILGGAL